MAKMTDEERRERERQQKYVSGRARDLALRRLANRHGRGRVA